MPLEIVVGAPFSGKGHWVSAEIEKREADGELALLSLNFTALYAALAPGDGSVYRDEAVSDTGVPRFASYLLAAAIGEAGRRELHGYVAVDSPRRAVQAIQQLGIRGVIEVVVPEATALKRAETHVGMVKALAPRAGTDDAKAAAARCRKMVRAYYRERDVLKPLDVRKVQAPDRPSDQAIQFAWRAAIKAAKRGDAAGRDQWKAAATRMLAVRGVKA